MRTTLFVAATIFLTAIVSGMQSSEASAPKRAAVSCHITIGPEKQLKVGDSVTWACPKKMAAGNYQVSFEVLPGKQYPNPLRVQYHVTLDWGQRLDKGKIISRASPPAVTDIGVDALIGNKFNAGGEIVTIDAGPAAFNLKIDFSWDHGCFGPSCPNDVGIITIPSTVSISLDKV